MKRLECSGFKAQFNRKLMELSKKHAYIYFYASYFAKKKAKYMVRTFFSWKSGYRTEKVFLQVWIIVINVNISIFKP